MTDLEMTKLCAKAMGYRNIECSPIARLDIDPGKVSVSKTGTSPSEQYDPLNDDAQAMALLKRFNLDISRCDDGDFMVSWGEKLGSYTRSDNLNRAIVEAVAKMQNK
jgi:hypothetical protein